MPPMRRRVDASRRPQTDSTVLRRPPASFLYEPVQEVAVLTCLQQCLLHIAIPGLSLCPSPRCKQGSRSRVDCAICSRTQARPSNHAASPARTTQIQELCRASAFAAGLRDNVCTWLCLHCGPWLPCLAWKLRGICLLPGLYPRT